MLLLNFIDAEVGTKSGKRLAPVLVGGKVPSPVGDRLGLSVGLLDACVPEGITVFVETDSIVVGSIVIVGVGTSTIPASFKVPDDGDPVWAAEGLAVGFVVVGLGIKSVGYGVFATTGLFVGLLVGPHVG